MTCRAFLVACILALVSREALAAGDLTDHDPGQGAAPEDVEAPGPSSHELLLPIGPLVIERGPEVDRNIFFPILFHQVGKGKNPYSFLGVAPFYWRYRGGQNAERKGDVIFPFVWLFDRPDKLSLSVPPFYLEKWSDGAVRAGLAPLVFVQRTPKLDYTVVPPVFFHFAKENRKFFMSTLFFYHRKGSDVDMGLPPLFMNGWNDKKGYLVVFPVAWHFENYTADRTDTVVGPVWFGRRGTDWQMLVFPLVFASGGKSGASFNVIPILHWDSKGGGTRVVSPLGWYWKSPEKDIHGGGVLNYHRYRKGDFTFQTFAPFWFNWRSDNVFKRSNFILPVGYFSSGPIHRNVSVLGLVWDFYRFEEHRTTVVLPLFAHDKDLYREKHTTWVFPTIQYSRDGEKWQFNVHPLAYFNGGEPKTHQVVFPVWWRFASPGKIAQIAFPLWWDFQNLGKGTRGMSLFPLFWRFERPEGDGDHTVVLNAYHWKADAGRKAYRFALFPLFGFGKDEQAKSSYWKILLGMVGWKTTEHKDYLYLLWLPLKVRDDTPAVVKPQG